MTNTTLLERPELTAPGVDISASISVDQDPSGMGAFLKKLDQHFEMISPQGVENEMGARFISNVGNAATSGSVEIGTTLPNQPGFGRRLTRPIRKLAYNLSTLKSDREDYPFRH
jgi:hypothetical protein